MKNLKEAILDTLGMALIGSACILYHEGKQAGLESFDLCLLAFACGLPAFLGRYILKRSVKCEK